MFSSRYYSLAEPISPRSTAIQLKGRIANFLALVDVARRAAKEGAVSLRHGGAVFCSDDLDNLIAVHEEMLGTFRTELEVIEQRSDERL